MFGKKYDQKINLHNKNDASICVYIYNIEFILFMYLYKCIINNMVAISRNIKFNI